MAYSEFTIKKAKDEFGLKTIENKNIFEEIESVEVSDDLKIKLEENVPLALAINTEKARSEFIIAFVLLELRNNFKDRSGTRATSSMKSRKFSSLSLMSSNPIPLDAYERPIFAKS